MDGQEFSRWLRMARMKEAYDEYIAEREAIRTEERLRAAELVRSDPAILAMARQTGWRVEGFVKQILGDAAP